jgi:hypothetical protein
VGPGRWGIRDGWERGTDFWERWRGF